MRPGWTVCNLPQTDHVPPAPQYATSLPGSYGNHAGAHPRRGTVPIVPDLGYWPPLFARSPDSGDHEAGQLDAIIQVAALRSAPLNRTIQRGDGETSGMNTNWIEVRDAITHERIWVNIAKAMSIEVAGGYTRRRFEKEHFVSITEKPDAVLARIGVVRP